MPLPLIKGILKNALDDGIHVEGAITTSRLTGCPRNILISDFIGPEAPRGGLVFDPRKMNSIMWGWALHDWAAKYADEGDLVEVRVPREGVPPIELDFGGGVKVPVSGRVDYMSPDMVFIDDYKTHSEYAQGWKYKKLLSADAEYVVQFNVNRTIVETDIPGTKVTKGAIWHGAMTSNKSQAPPWFEQPLPVVPLQEIGGMKAKGAKHTVREIASMLLWGRNEILGLSEPRNSPEWYEKVDRIIAALPMVGEPMFSGDMCMSYCGAPQPYCFALAGKVSLL